MPSLSKIIKKVKINAEDTYFLKLPLNAELKSDKSNKEELVFEKDIEKANEESKKIIAKAKAEAEEIFRKAKDEGYQAGFRQGMEEARREGNKIKDEARALLSSAFEKRDQIIKESEKIITEIVLKALKRLVDNELEKNQDFLSSIIEKLIKEVSAAPSYLIYTHPQRKKEVENALLLMEIEKKLPLGAKISVLDDPILEKNDVRVETEEEVAEFSLELFLQEVGANMTVKIEKND